jgi:hypothetical protein
MPGFWHPMKLTPRNTEASKREIRQSGAPYRGVRPTAVEIQAAAPNQPPYMERWNHPVVPDVSPPNCSLVRFPLGCANNWGFAAFVNCEFGIRLCPAR